MSIINVHDPLGRTATHHYPMDEEYMAKCKKKNVAGYGWDFHKPFRSFSTDLSND